MKMEEKAFDDERTLDTGGTMTKVQYNDDLASFHVGIRVGCTSRYEYELVRFERRCAGSIFSRGSGLLPAVTNN
jgi:hypothetical protein